MSDDKDPQRISDAADNCEVLRARLSQYEDAEGRPLQPAADLARRIDQAITDFTSGRACMHVPPFDTDVDIVLSECLKIANALESQAREIERLGAELENTLVSWGQVRLELAALKAQPSGVVLSQTSLTAAVDAAMVEMQNISPPLRRSECERLIRAAITALTASAPSHGEQMLDGWVLVPVEPTPEMISAASGAITTPDDLPPIGVGGWSMSDLAFRSRYRAALAAAPSAGSQEQGE